MRSSDDRGFFEVLLGDGTPLLTLSALCLILSGVFAIFLGATGHFLPHDIQFLGMEPEEFCAINECRIVHFMIHDRVSFGGAILAVGTLYLWLALFPLRQGQAWAWWAFVLSGVTGFGSFLAYLGYGYLDTWHGAATLGLLPCFAIGLARSSRIAPALPEGQASAEPFPLAARREPRPPWPDLTSWFGFGHACLLATGAGLMAGGLTIMVVGMTTVFVPQDLAYMSLTAEDLHAVNPRLVPLIAHDRAGFGGGVCTLGLLMLLCVWYGTPSRSLWQALAVAGTAVFVTAIGVHPVIGYNDVVHLAPAVAGAALFTTGMCLTYRRMLGKEEPCGSREVRGPGTGDTPVAHQ